MTRSPSPEPPTVLLVGVGAVADRCAQLLTDSGVAVTAVQPGAPLPALDDFAAAGLAGERPLPELEKELDDACWTHGTAWTLGLLLAHEFQIGPTVVPERTPCHACWLRRVRSQSNDVEVHDAIREAGIIRPESPWFAGVWPVLVEQVGALLAGELLSLASGDPPLPSSQRGRYWRGDAVFGSLESHEFARVGTCPRCVRDDQRPGGSEALGRYVRKRFTEAVFDGSDRQM